MMLCGPGLKLLVVSVATALEFKFAVPSDVVPSRKVTDPVGVPGVVEVMLALNFTAWP